MLKNKAKYNDILTTTTENKPVSHYTFQRFILCACVSFNFVSNQYVLHVLNTMLLKRPSQPNITNVCLFASACFRVSPSVSLSRQLSACIQLNNTDIILYWERSLIFRHFQYCLLCHKNIKFACRSVCVFAKIYNDVLLYNHI
jgi:hypothetical protein